MVKKSLGKELEMYTTRGVKLVNLVLEEYKNANHALNSAKKAGTETAEFLAKTLQK